MKKLLLSISIISSFAGAIRAQMPLTAGHQWTKAFPSVNIGIQTEQVTSKETNNGYIISAVDGRIATFGDSRHHGWPFRTNVPPVGFTIMR